MALRAQAEWKETVLLLDEYGRSFTIECGWGVQPPIAYVPPQDAWQRCTPDWLWNRREEAIEALRRIDHFIEDGEYPALNC